MISEGIKSVAEIGVMATASGVLIGAFVLQYKKTLSDNTNKEVLEELKALRKGYVSPEVLKDKVPYFVQGNRWKIQSTLMDIIRINNISVNPDITDKKINYLYDRAENRMSEMLEGMCDSNTKYLILQTYMKILGGNKAVIDSLFTALKKEHGKPEEEECKKNIKIEMEQFQERAITDIKELF